MGPLSAASLPGLNTTGGSVALKYTSLDTESGLLDAGLNGLALLCRTK